MIDIETIIESIQANRVIISRHAREEAENDNLKLEQILSSVMRGEIIKNYPEDRPYPSCLIYGKCQQQEPIHSVWAYNQDNGWAVLITVYRPDPQQWINWRTRRKSR
jgi:hypothetical protein